MKSLLLFTTPYCMPCKAFKPIFKEVSNKYLDVDFQVLQVAENRELARQYRVMSVPALVYVEHGVQMGFKQDPFTAEDIEEILRG